MATGAADASGTLPRQMRRVPSGLVLLVLSALVGACGSSTQPTSATTASHASSAASVKPLTKSQAQAFAHAVNLRAADLPGFKVSSEQEHETAAEKQQGHAFLSCVGRVASTKALLEANSPSFERATSSSTESVRSEVEVTSTPALAAEELAAARTGHARACLSRFLDQIFSNVIRREGGTVGAFSVTGLPTSAPGTAGSFGWAISTTFSLHGIKVPVRIHILGFGHGNALVVLFDFGFPQALPSSEEQHLFSLLVSRAESFRS